MSSTRTLVPVLVGLLVATVGRVLYEPLFALGGVLRHVEPFGVSPHTCEYIRELEACEDAWLHPDSGLLYLACSDVKGREKWIPAMDRLNAQGRPTTDAIYILDTTKTGPVSSRITKVRPTDFLGVRGDGTLNLHGMGVLETGDGDELTLFLVNHRPNVDPITGEVMDGTVFGANSTIETFETRLGSDTMRHRRTYFDPAIRTPNRVAPISKDSFIFTNDHASKTGRTRLLDYVVPISTVGLCNPNGCKIVLDGLGYPNGIVQGKVPTHYYIPTMLDGKIRQYELLTNGSLILLDTISVGGPPGSPVDNISLDRRTGALVAAAFSKMGHAIQTHFADFQKLTPTTAYRITPLGPGETSSSTLSEGHRVEKILEVDGKHGSLGAYTTVVEDSERGRVFLAGIARDHVAICPLSPSK